MQFIDVFMEKVKLININMRCIEMKEGAEIMRDWIKININMRCIEILYLHQQELCHFPININMRCIEMLVSSMYNYHQTRLTLT